MKLIDRFLPSYDYREEHSISMYCSRRQAFSAIREITPAELPQPAGTLIWLRGIPARIARKPYPNFETHKPLVAQLTTRGFVVSDEEGESEIVFGLVGQYWKPHGGIYLVGSDEEFITFDRLDHTLVAVNFIVGDEPQHGSVRLTTETRIYTPGPAARRRFALYWRFIRPGSALIRRSVLTAIRKRAEQR